LRQRVPQPWTRRVARAGGDDGEPRPRGRRRVGQRGARCADLRRRRRGRPPALRGRVVLARARGQPRRRVDRARDRRGRRGADLADPVIGAPRVHHRVADSTNERAKQLAMRGAPHGTLVTAGEQTAGRGRQGRSWLAPAGGAVLMSLVLRELDERFPLLPLAASVAVSEACESLAPVHCEIKWPNDVWIDRRKVAGILVEGRPGEGWAVLGIGVNV